MARYTGVATAKLLAPGFKYNSTTDGKIGQGVVIDATDANNYEISLGATKGAQIHGILAEDCSANDYPAVYDISQGGIGPIRLGATLTNGAELILAADGDFIAQDAAGQVQHGTLITDGADGNVRIAQYCTRTHHA